jgi:hypothetical protein
MLDYTALITLIGFVALMFVPLYIPILVTVIGGIRRWREDFRQQAVFQHPTRAADLSSHSPRAVADAPQTAAATSDAVTDRVLPNAAWPAVEPV